ncbi:MAG: MFS transporter [Pseudomonadota bacterium]|nr:MFS transporter [Pseudomonadota bacterium]
MRLTAQQRISLTVLVAALGYFVDVFDLQLFSMVRVSSLKSLGLSPEAITSSGSLLLNWQMAGMLLGGLVWGVTGDKKGRVSVLFGTILVYSIGNIANAFVTTIPAYAAARFFTGLGLAGEIGAGVTLASELLPKSSRGYGTMIIVACGVMGPLVAGYVAELLNWRMVYLAGGCLGLLLLVLRVSVNESGLFGQLKDEPTVTRGQLRMLFCDQARRLRYVLCVAAAWPIWFILGSIVIFCPEIGQALDINEPLKATTATVAYYVGITLGGVICCLLSQVFQSRRKIMAIFLVGTAATTGVLLCSRGLSSHAFYGLVGLLGFGNGFWTLFLTTTAEQFGTNLRATATTTAPNFVRASVILNAFLISALKPALGYLASVQAITVLCFAVAFAAVWLMRETFGRDLNFTER